ncbi:MAG: UDP-N-acetylmuramate--L-alanine ligase, UDP-N-acetylmuramate--alanine ligase [Candidatus Parcubacteria bacterium]|jgi:UDP-N-acetylmuramate--alanine ligase
MAHHDFGANCMWLNILTSVFLRSKVHDLMQRMRESRIYMVGIGGIGMSALAQLLHAEGKTVSGSDRAESPTTELLKRKGISVGIGHDASTLPSDTELLIYSDAVWPDNSLRAAAVEMKIPQISYFEALGNVSREMRTIAVSGTHGKTTTTGMLAQILRIAGTNPTAVVGSIVRDFSPSDGGSNFLQGSREIFVVEACEYRDHLLELHPEVLVVTNIELDHTDFFPSLSAMQATFRAAMERVPAHGKIVTNPQDPNIAPLLTHVQAEIIDYTKEDVPDLLLIGEFNRMNARAAKAAARAGFADISLDTCDDALRSFKGSWRRFEFKGESKKGALIYDDYAHHPTAVESTIEAARQAFSDKRIIVAFHPHLYTRTRDLMDGFAKALAKADEVILAPIFPAREKPIPGVTSEALAEKVAVLGVPVETFSSLHDMYENLEKKDSLSKDSLLITMGAGDIYKVAEQLTQE